MNCEKCQEPNAVTEEGKITKTDCKKCGYWRMRYGMGDGQPLQGEWTRARKSELEANSKDVLQPRKKDGTINKHFVQAHGTKTLEKELKVSRKEILDNVERYG